MYKKKNYKKNYWKGIEQKKKKNDSFRPSIDPTNLTEIVIIVGIANN